MKDFKLPPYGCALFLKNSLPVPTQSLPVESRKEPASAPITAPLVPVETGQYPDLTINKTYNFQLDLEFNISGINPKVMVKSANYIDGK